MRSTSRLIAVVACMTCACSKERDPVMQIDALPADATVEVDAPANTDPIANAGPDTTYFIGATVGLDGSASTDPDGMLVAYQWSIEDRPVDSTAALVDADAVVASFMPDTIGTYTFALDVTDDKGATDRDTVTIVVERGAFTVDAGPDQTVVWMSTVHLAGSYVSESGPGAVTWQMTTLPANSSQIPQPTSSLTPTFFAERVGVFVAEMKVTSPAGTATDSVTITVIPPPPDPIDGNIVDVEAGWYSGQFAIASTNPNRIRMLAPYWPTPPSEMVIPLTVTPTSIGVELGEQFVYVIHDNTRLTTAWVTALSQLGTMNLGTPILEARGTTTPRVYPAQAGPLLLVDHENQLVYPGGLTPGPARGREFPSAERPLYALDIGANAKLRRYDGHDHDTALVREWPYPGGQYVLGNDLWVTSDGIFASAGSVFNQSEDPALDMTYRGFLSGDQPYEVVGVCQTGRHIATLHNRITTPPQLPESQVRFYNPTTLALESVVQLPDLVVGGVAQRTIGHMITVHAFPNRVYVIGSAVASPANAALFTIPEP